MSKYFIGIDLGGTNVEVGLLDESGNVTGRDSFVSEVDSGPESMADRMAQSCRKVIEAADVDHSLVKGLCIGSPGPLSVTEGKIIKAANLPLFTNFRLRGEVSGRVDIPATFENDANVACWGEFWMGAGKDVSHMVMFTLGTGIGGGIIAGGELIRGCNDNGAELGHLIVVPDGRLCGCGQKGCIEAYASANNTAVRAQEAVAQNSASSLANIMRQNGVLSCKDVFDEAAGGDQTALEVVDYTTKIIAIACVNMNHATEPQIAVMAGGMIKAGDFLLDKVRRHFNDLMWNLKGETTEILLAELGADAAVIGAAGLAMHSYENGTLYPPGQ